MSVLAGVFSYWVLLPVLSACTVSALGIACRLIGDGQR